MKLTAQEIASLLGGKVDGDPSAAVSSFARIETGKPGQLSFFANPKYESYVYTSKASVLLVNEDFRPSQPVVPTLVRVPDAYSAVAKMMNWMAALAEPPVASMGSTTKIFLFSMSFGSLQ